MKVNGTKDKLRKKDKIIGIVIIIIIVIFAGVKVFNSNKTVQDQTIKSDDIHKNLRSKVQDVNQTNLSKQELLERIQNTKVQSCQMVSEATNDKGLIEFDKEIFHVKSESQFSNTLNSQENIWETRDQIYVNDGDNGWKSQGINNQAIVSRRKTERNIKEMVENLKKLKNSINLFDLKKEDNKYFLTFNGINKDILNALGINDADKVENISVTLVANNQGKLNVLEIKVKYPENIDDIKKNKEDVDPYLIQMNKINSLSLTLPSYIQDLDDFSEEDD